MEQFTVIVTKNTGQRFEYKNTTSVSYSTQFMNNEWMLILEITCFINHDLKYINYDWDEIKKVEILNK